MQNDQRGCIEKNNFIIEKSVLFKSAWNQLQSCIYIFERIKRSVKKITQVMFS